MYNTIYYIVQHMMFKFFKYLIINPHCFTTIHFSFKILLKVYTFSFDLSRIFLLFLQITYDGSLLVSLYIAFSMESAKEVPVFLFQLLYHSLKKSCRTKRQAFLLAVFRCSLHTVPYFIMLLK